MNKTQRILGIDPGSRLTGVGIIDSDGQHNRPVFHTTLVLGKLAFTERLGLIFKELESIIQLYKPDCMAIENVFVAKNAASALKLGQARGAAICCGIVSGLSVAEYTPREIKQAVTGKGSADKAQIQHMTRILLNIKEPIKEDAADALGVAICHAHRNAFEQQLKKSLSRQ